MSEPGVYLVNATGEMNALLTESGEGDEKLLEEVMEEHGYELQEQQDE